MEPAGMRLADFILANIEPILAEWEAFARGVWKGSTPDPATLRDHAEAILRATAVDMMSVQTAEQQSAKSKGHASAGTAGDQMRSASVEHGVARLRSGFDLLSLLAEYRALRASVVRLWKESRPLPDRNDLDDLTRFNESIDQSIIESTERFARDSERARQLFLAMLGHDLRNPLNSIALSAQLISLNEPSDTESADAARQILVSSEAMTGIIEDLLDFATTRLGSGFPIELKTVDFAALCREVVAELQAGHPAAVVQVELSGDLWLDADAARLRQAISNLLGNAIQHGSEHEPVTLSAWNEEERVHLAVHNLGPPILPEALGTVFDPLVRGASPTSGRSRSIGLGLYIVREIVTAHGGEIDVTSSLEAGTTFSVSLPRRTAHEPAPLILSPTAQGQA